jgi:hypothetical protein
MKSFADVKKLRKDKLERLYGKVQQLSMKSNVGPDPAWVYVKGELVEDSWNGFYRRKWEYH